MAQPDPTSAPPRRPSPGKGYQLPPEVVEILGPSLQVGLGAGAAGLFVGAASGIVRSAAPVLFSLVTGAQWFALGSSFYAARQAAVVSWGGDAKVSCSNAVKASVIGGAAAGLVGGAIRGPRNILPAVAVFSLFGGAGQAMYNALPAQEGTSKKTGWLESKWSPVKPLTDTEYAAFLEDKMLKLEVEISMVDDKIAELLAKKAQQTGVQDQRTDNQGGGHTSSKS